MLGATVRDVLGVESSSPLWVADETRAKKSLASGPGPIWPALRMKGRRAGPPQGAGSSERGRRAKAPIIGA